MRKTPTQVSHTSCLGARCAARPTADLPGDTGRVATVSEAGLPPEPHAARGDHEARGVKVEDPPAARGQLGRGDPHQCAGDDVAQPMAVVVEPGPRDARRQAIETYLGPGLMNVVRERR